MIQFTYSFSMAMLHSFWQAGLLLLLYIAVDKFIHRNNAPLAKRNFLYVAIAAQLALFALTFLIYFFDTSVNNSIAGFSQNLKSYMAETGIQAITPWIFSLYVFIIGYKFLKAIYCWYHFKQQYKTGLQKPSVELKLFTELKAHQFGIKKNVKLWLSHSIHTPVTFGFFKPIILLPVALVNNISVRQAETLVLHELTHIRTNDYLLNWFLLTAETIFFFNPFVIDLCKKIRLEREKNCDISVMAFEYAPALYAETLLQAERMKNFVPSFQLAAVNSKKHLLQRIQFFTSEKVVNQTLRFNIITPIVGLILLLVISASVIFQSGNTAIPLHSNTEMQYFPFNNHIISDADIIDRDIYPVLNVGTSIPADKQAANPGASDLRKTIAQPEPVCNPEPQIIDEIVKPVELNYALPIAMQENDASRRIIIQEEGSGSASVKVYYLSFEDGSWILKPELVITAKEIADSLTKKVDTLKANIKTFYPDQQ